MRRGCGPGPRPWCHRTLSLLPALCLLAGCALVDQNTFAPAPEAKPVAAAPAGATAPVRFDSRRPLVTIDHTAGAPHYQDLLRYAVHAAEARDRGVQFDVVAVVASADAAAAGQRNAIGVMRAIMADGVPAERIHLGLRAEPGLPAQQVRVYVR